MRHNGCPTLRTYVLRHADVDGRKLVVDAETTPLRQKVMSAMPLEFGHHEKTTGV
jgi:hypothetical protein